jgi:peptidoglycan/LPS O-acetylase OafA/YrhL
VRTRLWHTIREELFSRPGGHFASLDGIRAIAALIIVLFHCAVCVEHAGPESFPDRPLGVVLRFLGSCWVGVDIFFVLSGFLIGRILFLQLARGAIDFKGFYIRRVFRIFPPYYVVLTLSLLLFSRLDTFRFVYGTATWAELLRRSPANYLYVSNYLFGARVANALEWSWSLCIEEHFYLLFPALLAVLFRRVSRPYRPAVLAVLTLIPLAARSMTYARTPDIVVWNGVHWESHTHADGLLLGALIAYGHLHCHAAFGRLVSRVGSAAWLAALACFASVFWFGGMFRTGVFPVVLQYLALAVGTSLVMVSCLFVDSRLSRFLAHPLWCPVARLSYGLYLVHLFPVLWLLSVWPGGRQRLVASTAALLAFTAVAVVLSLLSAAALFFSFERQLLEYGARLSRRYTTAEAARRNVGDAPERPDQRHE